MRIINTARGELIDEAALADAIKRGHVAGAGLDVFSVEPPPDQSLVGLPQVVATPHIAASTVEAQELVGIETAMSVRDYLRDGAIRNAVNFPPAGRGSDSAASLYDSRRSARRPARADRAGPHAWGRHPLLRARRERRLRSARERRDRRRAQADPVGRGHGDQRARGRRAARIEIIESRSSRPRDFANLLSVKIHTSDGERWVEGTVFEPGSARLTAVDGVEIEAPLEGTLILIKNEDQPGVIGEVGTILGKAGVNIANFALGRGQGGAVCREHRRPAVRDGKIDRAIEAIRAIPAVTSACLVKFY